MRQRLAAVSGKPKRLFWPADGSTLCHERSSVMPEFTLPAPLLQAIRRHLSAGQPLTLAIDGCSAAGKTTLARRLQEKYGCPVFHTDDYFLQAHQRTPQRLSQPGGNMDRERFLQEVLLPLSRGEDVTFRRFDCSAMALTPPVTVPYAPFQVVEGTYCLHPELAPYYTYSVFLRISPEEQRRRILCRCTPEKAQQFFHRWIPLEQLYFQQLRPDARCDLILEDLV